MSRNASCNCTAFCGDDPRLKRQQVTPCPARRAAEQRVLRDAVAMVMLKEMGHVDTLAALQELKALRAKKGA